MTIQEYVDQLLGYMLIEPEAVTVEEGEEYVSIRLSVPEEDAGKMIGKHGETLTSMGHIVTLSFRDALTDENGEVRRVVVDINAYKERKEDEALEIAKEIAQQVVDEQEPQALPRSFQPHQRRVIHQALQDFEGVFTQSEGQGRDRRLVIYPISYQDHESDSSEA